MVLEPDGDQAEDEREGEEGKARPQVPPADPPPPPPGMQQDHAGKHDHGALGQQRQEEPEQAEPVVAAAALRVVVGIGRHREQQERQRKRVLQLGRPGDGFHRQGMHREEQPPDPRRLEADPAQQPPEQERAQEMQGHADGMVARGVRAPEAPFEPLDSRLQREIIGADAPRPDLRQSGGIGQHRIGGHLLVVVPQPAGGKRRTENPEAGPQDQEHPGEGERGRSARERASGVHGDGLGMAARIFRACSLSGHRR